MPSYLEGDNVEVIVGGSCTMIKPILFTTYDAITKYILHITYEDSTTKDVELVQNCKDRPYKFTYKKNGQLLNVIGIPKIYEINEGNKFTDFANKVMDSNDLLFVVDHSSMFDCNQSKFYLKDIRDIIDLANEEIEDPDDPMEVYPFTMYPIYLEEHSCHNVIHCEVDDNLKVTLTSRVTRLGDTLEEDEYSDFQVLSISSPVTIDSDILPENNKISLVFTEDSLNSEIKIILKYFIKEIKHPVFDEFTIIANRKKPIDPEEENINPLDRAVSTQDMQYLGDGLLPGLGNDLTPGFKSFRYRKKKK